MASLRAASLLLMVAVLAVPVSSDTTAVTPMEKVITLLEDLQAEVESDGKAEATSYDKFACFCKDTNDEKSDAIKTGQDEIDRLSAEIESKTAESAELSTEVMERKQKLEEVAKELAGVKARCLKEETEYMATAADLSRAITAIEGAIKALEASKPASLLAITKSLRKSLAVAEALNFIEPKKVEVVTAFVQGRAHVDPEDPEYKFHSKGILEVLEKLLVEFRAEKSDVDAAYEKSKKACDELIEALSGQMEENKAAIAEAEETIEKLKKEIADATENLVNTESQLKDDQSYLKDLTVRCEARAKDWDQRTQMRADELAALKEALSILKDSAQELDKEVNQRAEVAKKAKLLLARSHIVAANATQPKPAAHVAPQPRAAAAPKDALAFLQTARSRALRLLGPAPASAASPARALALLQRESRRLRSPVLLALADRVAADPFAKVKALIQQLLERLIKEATSEATKKGFCDTELGKINQDRDNRYADLKKLNSELAGLEAQKTQLEEGLEELAKSLKELHEALEEATKLRADENKENLEIVKKANEGVIALNEAIATLKEFYKQSAKAKVLLQASPVDEDTDGAGFSGAYKGKQESAKGVIGLLEVIKSDFERTSRKTEAAEKQALADFVEFERTSKTDIAGKETQTKLDEQELESTKNDLGAKMRDLQTNMDLLDDALKEIEELKPTCIDTGMSYADRVAKREAEIEALKKALCLLDGDKVEPECQ